MNPKPLMIAHRGASVYELENTKEAFIAAGNRTFWGIETDIRLTKDGEIVIFHDETLKRLAGMEAKVSDFDFAEVREISLKGRFDHIEASRIPTLSEYLKICKHYRKKCVIEFKGGFDEAKIDKALRIIKDHEMFDQTTIISFNLDYLLYIRKIEPDLPIQYLTGENLDEEKLRTCIENRFDLDLQYQTVTKELVDIMHQNDLKVNCWTVDDPTVAQELTVLGVDYITSNGLE